MSEDKITSEATVKGQWDNASNKQKKVHHLQTEATFEMVSSIYDWMKSEKAKLAELGGKRSLVIGALLIGLTWLCSNYVTFHYGTMLASGDGIEQLREERNGYIEQQQINQQVALEHNRNSKQIIAGLTDQVMSLNQQNDLFASENERLMKLRDKHVNILMAFRAFSKECKDTWLMVDMHALPDWVVAYIVKETSKPVSTQFVLNYKNKNEP